MAKRIPQSFIDELLAKTDIVSVIERHIPLKKKGSNYSALCPFHNEKSPSFSVSPSKQFFYCFGCGASGNAIGFLMDYERLEFLDAIETLASQAGMQVPTTELQTNPDYQNLLNILEKAQQFYHIQLNRHPAANEARQYLQQRGLSPEIIKRYGIGFAPPGWDNLLASQAQQKSLLLKAGLLTENENGRVYDRFRHRIMFPIRDRRGRIIGFGGRVLDDSQPKYLNSPETPVFHKGQELYGLYEARQANTNLSRLVVVEGYMDVISLAEHGVNYAVATLGTAVTANHLKKLLSACKEVIFSFDGDSAGERAAWKALETALPQLHENNQIKFVFMPKNEDPDSFIKAQGQAAYESLLENADPLSKFFFEHLSEQVNLENVEGRAQLIGLAMPYLQTINAPITKELLIGELAKLSRTPIEKIQEWSFNKSVEPPAVTPHKIQQPQKHTPIRIAISLLVQYPKAGQQVTSNLPDADIPGLKLLKQLLELIKANPNITTGSLLEYWRNKPEAVHLAKLASTQLLTPESGVTSELEDTFKRISLIAIDQKIDYFLTKAKRTSLTSEEKKQLTVLLNDRNTGL